ncbi:hypothetical protein V8F20_006446 [Naviculisporaceae sp. PSN 640]
MKWFVLAAFAGAATAQGSEVLPPCGQTCIDNMIGQWNFLGCPSVDGNADAVCLCDTPDFGYGIRDCANQHCSPEYVGAVITYAQRYCQAVENVVASAPAVYSILGTPAEVSKPASPSPTESATPSIKTPAADIVTTLTSGDQDITTTLHTSITAVATGTPDNEDAHDNASSDLRGQNKENDDDTTATATATTDADAADVTGTDESNATQTFGIDPTSASQAGAVPMITGALSGFANAPVAIAAAAVLLL